MRRMAWVISLGALLILPFTASAKMGSGKVSAYSSEVNIEIFGSLKTYPTFLSNGDFNRSDTQFDRLLDENGFLDEVSVRNEARLGFKGGGPSWSFLTILEADFTYSKANADRGANLTDPKDGGFTGEDFGIEKLEFTYDFGPFSLETGWQTKTLDIETGGLVYGDDHPFIGLEGSYNDVTWEALFLTIQDDIDPVDGENINKWDSSSLDWRAYTAKVNVPVHGLNISPFYAFSENNDHSARAHYIGLESYGKFGRFTPRAEVVYAGGSKNLDDGDEADIGAFAAFGALEMEVAPLFNPYIGGYYVSGDDAAGDDDIKAFNPITNLARYTPTFGMENAFIYRFVPVIGSHLYSNVPDTLGSTPGYGGISNSAKAESPGMMSVGLGSKGSYDAWRYKMQFMYFWFEETGALEDVEGIDHIGDDLGWEWDLQLVYQFNKYFSIGNVFAVFDPGEGVEDLRGDEFDDTAFLDTIELTWSF